MSRAYRAPAGDQSVAGGCGVSGMGAIESGAGSPRLVEVSARIPCSTRGRLDRSGHVGVLRISHFQICRGDKGVTGRGCTERSADPDVPEVGFDDGDDAGARDGRDRVHAVVLAHECHQSGRPLEGILTLSGFGHVRKGYDY